MTSYHPLLIYSISYVLFFAWLWLSKAKKGNRLLNETGTVTNYSMLIALHIGGILLLGILPAYFLNHSLTDTVFGKSAADNRALELTALLIILSVIITPILAEKKYAEVSGQKKVSRPLSIGFIISYFIVRILFIYAYELWFRGFLLTDCINNMGIPAAIILNVALYTLLHTVNGKNEMLACIPFGLLLCSLCIWLHAAWPAIALHLALTVPYETYIVRKINNPSNSRI